MKHTNTFGRIILLGLIAGFLFVGCHHGLREPQANQETPAFQSRMDSLERQIHSAYTPGYGELMLNIQVHHAKLWFAGTNSNWALAAYNEGLIRSAFRKIRLYHPGDPNTAATTMIDGPLDSIAGSISLKSLVAFRRSFGLLTLTCNNCHTVTGHAFNVIAIPHAEPFGNQDFSIKPTVNH